MEVDSKQPFVVVVPSYYGGPKNLRVIWIVDACEEGELVGFSPSEKSFGADGVVVLVVFRNTFEVVEFNDVTTLCPLPQV